jgi:limonene-1,2-epoxide hydrolase
MESPIEVVRRFCAAWSDNMEAAELAAFFTEDAVYHNIPQEPVTGRENIAKTIASVLRPGRQASRASISASSTSQPMVRS